jgi:hypothetical protein
LIFVPVLAALLYVSALSQEPTSPPAPSAAAQKPDQTPTDQSESKSDAQTKITPQQAEQLFRDVDTILDFASKDSSLPIKHGIKRRLTSREEVVSYLQKNMAEDKDVQRLKRTELVLAHELTHALQDQSFGLDKWLKRGSDDLDSKKNLTADDMTKDENSEARQAVVEGQAMVVLLDYMLAPMHRTVADSPGMVDMMNEEMRTGSADSVQYKNAPIFLKESLTFPYRYGIQFEAELMRAQGKEKAFAGPFENPPRTSREIMEPRTYILGEHVLPLELPDFKRIFKDYERFDIGAIGEFDVAVLAEQYAGEEASKKIYPNWRGGYYYSVHPKGNPAGPLGLMFVSRWSSDKGAAQFAAIYARGMLQRYKNLEANAHSDLDLKKLESLSGDYTWLTEEGPVVIAVRNDTVLVTESLDPAITDEFRHAVLGTAPKSVQ